MRAIRGVAAAAAVAIGGAALIGVGAPAAQAAPRTMSRAWLLTQPTGVSRPVIASTRAIFAMRSVVRAVALSDGHTIWSVNKAPNNKYLYLASPALVNGRVVVPFEDTKKSAGGNYTFDPANGHATTFGPVVGHYFGTPTVRSGLVATTTADLSGSTPTSALTFANRNWLIYSGSESIGLGQPTIGGGRAYVSYSQEEFEVTLLGFDPTKPCPSSPCAPSWSAQLGGVAAQPSTSNGSRVAVSLDFNGMGVYNGATGALVWYAAPDKAWLGGSASALGKVFVGASDSTLRVYNEQGCGHSTCSPLWTASAPGPITAAPVVAGGHVFVATSNGRVAEYDANGCGTSVCAPIAIGDTGVHKTANTAQPVVAGGLVLAMFDNRLAAFKIV